jgi:valyl-tRNA synthetase
LGSPNRSAPAAAAPRWQRTWSEQQTYAFDPSDTRPIFAVDTPPPTVSGEIHIGHVYSYVQAEAMIRFWRMQGLNVYYPFGFDDNGLPTERYVERKRGIRARDLSRTDFIAACLETSREVEDRFEIFWKSLGMSVDWRLRYSTIDPHARRISQRSFIELYRKGRVYRAQAPNPWCVECQTAIAQAELDDAERETTFYTLAFGLAAESRNRRTAEPAEDPGPRTQDPSTESPKINGDLPATSRQLQAGDIQPSSIVHRPSSTIPIATTRPELLPACVAIFVHPDDPRYRELIGGTAIVPIVERHIPILADLLVDPNKGSGAVMCCTFGDTTDVAWWRSHNLPLIPLVTRSGFLGEAGGIYAGLTLAQARARILDDLRTAGTLTDERKTTQSIRIHERCKTPVEILETSQWFIRVLDLKEQLLAAGRAIEWRPEHMRTRYEHWVENLNWDWSISRQRFYGVPFPLWHCIACGEIILADEGQLPVDPVSDMPSRSCSCGADLRPETDVMDTWATSSMSPQIATHFLETDDLRLHGQATQETRQSGDGRAATSHQPPATSLHPMQLRPQAHDIIRTWAFDTIVKSLLHTNQIPWETIMISGHALAPDGTSIHKSLGNSPIAPSVLIGRHSADALRYWACGATLGADLPVSEGEMKQGLRLSAKLWSAARFLATWEAPSDGGRRAVDDGTTRDTADQRQTSEPPTQPSTNQSASLPFAFTPADRALISWTQRTIERATEHYRRYEYAAARAAAERFFWDILCDHALEWSKGRLYDGGPPARAAAQASLRGALLASLQLLAPIMPHVTEEIYQRLFAASSQPTSLHASNWPVVDGSQIDPEAERAGEALIALGAAARRYKTNNRLGMGTRLAELTITCADAELQHLLEATEHDIRSLTRAEQVTFLATGDRGEQLVPGLRMDITP